MRKHSRIYLTLALLILLLQFALRVHNPDQLPFFIDEYRHIQRSQLVYTLDHNPIEFTHGKLLLYYYLGLFHPEGHSSIIVGRLSIALISLVTGATAAAITQRLFGHVAGLFALAFYALVPHAVFYERLALADPLASALATLSVWQLLHFIEFPTRRRAIVTGALISGAVLAKLTAALLMGIPVIAVMLLRSEKITERSRKVIAQWSNALWQQYGDGLKVIGLICLVPWLGLLVLAVICIASGQKPILFPTRMIGLQFNTMDAIRYRVEVLNSIIDTLLSVPLTLALLVVIPVSLWRVPRRTLFVLLWLGTLWGPSLIVTWQPETRYLLIGYPALAVLVGASCCIVVYIAQRLAKWTKGNATDSTARLAGRSAFAAGFGVWAALFAIPFGLNASRAPEILALPRTEIEIFFMGSNGWAVSSALEFLDKHAARIDTQVPVIGRFHVMVIDQDYCGLVELYVPESFEWKCDVIPATADDKFKDAISGDFWPSIVASAGQRPYFYLVTDVPPPAAPPETPLVAELIYENQRPHNGSIVRVWRVTFV